ncbi:MAG: hypothetical protein IBX62_02445 [Coriobacteriia bacterium]|nr:hypothetical protein [Coriobacteriia bacterium]
MGRLGRLALLSALSAAAALPAFPAPPARAEARAQAYEHLWQAETALGGERGRTAKRVGRSTVTLAAEGGRFRGTVRYEDVLGAEDPSGFHSQSGSITLVLTGAFVESGRTAGGTFEGTVYVNTVRVASLDEAVAEGIEARSDGVRVAYAVSGHWGAAIEDGRATGELLYEQAEVVRASAPDAPAHGPGWFNRLGPALAGGSSPPGEPQTFTAILGGDPPAADPGPGDAGAGGNGGAGGAAAPRPVVPAGPGSPDGGPGFWRYVLRGLAGRPRGRGVPASPEALRAARALRDARPSGAVPLPPGAVAIDLDVSGAYLDALNRASGLTAEEDLAGFEPIGETWASARRDSPGRPAAPAEADPSVFHAARLLEALEGQGGRGAGDLAESASAIAEGRAFGAVPELRAWTFAAEAVRGVPGARSVLAATAGAVRLVRQAPVPREGPDADAVLAAADSALAPREAREVAAFVRAPSMDASASAGEALPVAVLARAPGGALSWESEGARTSVRPARFPAYRRADGRVYWLAGEDGPAALTDGTLRGWAFTLPRAWLVDPARVGRILAEFPAG